MAQLRPQTQTVVPVLWLGYAGAVPYAAAAESGCPLNKRKNPTSILFYQGMGYLPEALVNYLGRMGWSMPDESEKFSLAQMQDAFDIQRVSLGGPVFDVEN